MTQQPIARHPAHQPAPGRRLPTCTVRALAISHLTSSSRDTRPST